MKVRQLLDILDLINPDAEIVVRLFKADATVADFTIEEVIEEVDTLDGAAHIDIYEETAR